MIKYVGSLWGVDYIFAVNILYKYTLWQEYACRVARFLWENVLELNCKFPVNLL